MVEMTAATMPLMLGEIEYTASPLKDRDYVELDRWVQAELIRVARDSCEGLSPQEKAETMSLAMQTAVTVNWGDASGNNILNTIRGLARVTFQMLRDKHPEVTHESIMALMRDPTNIENALLVFQKLNMIEDTSGGNGQSKNLPSP